MKLPTLPGLEITLSIDGTDLQEYDVEAGADEADSTRFVEAVPGAKFAVNVRLDQHFKYIGSTLAPDVLLDGRTVKRPVWEPLANRLGTVRTVSGVETLEDGRWLFKEFTFAELKTSDAKPEAHLKEKLAKLGEVTIVIRRARKVGSQFPAASSFQPAVDAADVPEKALKGRAISSHATFSEGKPTAPMKYQSIEFPWGSQPFVEVTFRYRSRKDLQIEGIIPRSPSPAPLEDRDPDTLTAEEARELVRIQRQKLLDRAQVKKEKRERDEGEEDGGNDGDVTVTDERRKRPRLSNDSGIEVIDLSNEDDEDD